jgi:hypothetical protein
MPIASMKKLLALIVPTFFISGCDLINPVKMLSCKMNGIKESMTMSRPETKKTEESLFFIFDTNTGKNYGYDEFSEKLKLEDGTIKEKGWTSNIKTVLVNEIWKRQVTGINPYYRPSMINESTVEVDLKKMKLIKYENYFRYNAEVSSITKGSGECKWKDLQAEIRKISS